MSDQSPATLAAIFSKITSRADRSYKLEFETRELSGQDATTLMQLLHNEGYLLFAPNPIQETDIPDEKADSMTNQKTQAQRLRAVIFKIWETNGKNGSFETFYQSYMEKIIGQLKEKIGG
jgi:hypothetical protein